MYFYNGLFDLKISKVFWVVIWNQQFGVGREICLFSSEQLTVNVNYIHGKTTNKGFSEFSSRDTLSAEWNAYTYWRNGDVCEQWHVSVKLENPIGNAGKRFRGRFQSTTYGCRRKDITQTEFVLGKYYIS